MRRTLFNLHQTPIAGWIVSEQETIALSTDETLLVVIERFSTLLNHTEPGTPNAGDLEDAVQFYTADFLDGFYLRDSELFYEWAFVQRERYRRQILEALDRLTTINTAEGRYAAAEKSARRQLEIDNLRETAWRQLMTAMAENGSRPQALTAFEECRQLLMNELGMEPAEETQALMDEIKVAADSGSRKTGPAIVEEALLTRLP